MKNKHVLLNKKYERDRISMLEQYKIICESADKVTEKRQNTNNFYLAVNTFLVGFAGYLATIELKIVPVMISIIGVIVSIVWHKNIDSFKKLNSAKFRVIHAIEEYLPLKVYKKEDEYLKGYYKLTSCEKYIPLIFGIIYTAIITIIIYYFY